MATSGWLPVVALLAAAVAVGQPVAALASIPSGEVQTVAGPGFCTGLSLVDPSSRLVGALSVGAAGVLYVEAGRPQEGRLVRVDREGRVTLLSVGTGPGYRLPGRLASDGGEGVFVAMERSVVLVGSARGGLIAGSRVSGGDEGLGSGDGGPSREARLGRVLGLASDPRGLFVAEEQLPGEVAVRFVNRSRSPVTFPADGSPGVTVEPGAIDTIARITSAGRSGRPVLWMSMAVSSGRLYLAASTNGPGTRPAVRMMNLESRTMTAHGIAVAPGALVDVAGGQAAGFSGDRGPATAAAIGSVGGISTDEHGNLYVADSANHRIRRVDVAGTISTVAGSGRTGSSGGGFNGNDHPARAALLQRPTDVDVGPGGQVYVSDGGNGQVRVIDTAGRIRAAPGNGAGRHSVCGAAGRGSERGEVPVRGEISAVALDGDGTVYLALAASGQVKRVEPDGRLTTVAGAVGPAPVCMQTATCPDSRLPASADLVRLGRPVEIAVGPGPGLYILERDPPLVRYVNLGRRFVRVHGFTVPPGMARVIAGAPAASDGRDGRSATEPRLSPLANALAVGPRGDLYIGDGDQIRQLDGGATISTVAMSASDGVPGTVSSPKCCKSVSGLATDASGVLYVGDSRGHRVWAVNPGSGPVQWHGQALASGRAVLVAGNGRVGFAGDGRPATEAAVSPGGISLGPDGSLFIAEVAVMPALAADGRPLLDASGDEVGDPQVVVEHSVRKVDPAGVISTVAGSGAPGFNGDGLPPSLTRFLVPVDVDVDRCGNLFVADSDNDRVRRVQLALPCARMVTREPKPIPLRLVLLLLVIGASVLATADLARRRS